MADDFVHRVRGANDIVTVIGEYVKLRLQGRNYVGLCPFHQEKTPSFSVSPEKQLFYCFGCQAGGDVFRFLELWEGADFAEALETLAQRAGLEREPGEKRSASPVNRQKQELFQVMEQATAFYQRILWETDSGRQVEEYCQRRGLDGSMLEKFRLGASPRAWDSLLSFSRRQKLPVELLVKAGLAVPRERGGHYDRFRGRLMFPLWDPRGKVIGFGARVLGQEEPRYLNTPETPLFSKGRHLYALHLARRAMRQKGAAVLVEGYLDAIALHQFGWENAVAVLGTALTEEQARLLRQNTDKVILAFDPDASGRQAALKGIAQLRRQGLEVRVMQLPGGTDPDDLVRERGIEVWSQLADRALPVLDFYLERIGQELDLDNPVHVRKAAEQVVPLVAQTGDAVEREAMVRQASSFLGVRPEALWEDLKRKQEPGPGAGAGDRRRDKGRRKAHPVQQNPPPASQKAQESLLGLCLTGQVELERVLPQMSPEDFTPGAHREVARALWEHYRAGNPVDAGQLARFLSGEEAQTLVYRVALEAERLGFSPRYLQDCLVTLQRERLHREIQELRRAILDLEPGGNQEDKEKLLQELNVLYARYRNLA